MATHHSPPSLRLDDLDSLRDRTFRRLPKLRVRTAASALRFVNEVGFASLFVSGLNLPCLWVAVCGRRDPEFPQHSHHDPEVGLAWNLKDELPAARKVFYAKLVRGKPTFVALDLLPDVLCLRRSRRDYRQDYRDGLLSPAAKAILDALHEKRPQETFELKLATNLMRPAQRRTFDNALAELQQRLEVVMCEARYEPTFTYLWDLVDARFPDAVRMARRQRPDAAARRVAQRYLDAVVFAKPEHVQAVTGNHVARNTIEKLVHEQTLLADQSIDGLPGRWLVTARSRWPE